MTETRVLLDLDRRARSPHDRRLRADRRLSRDAKGAARDRPGGGAPRARGVRAARSRRRGSSDGQEGLVHPQGRWTSSSAATPTSQSPAPSRNRPLMQKNPYSADRGPHHRPDAAGVNRAFIFIRGEYRAPRPRSSTPRWRRRRPHGYLRRPDPRLRLLVRDVGAPRAGGPTSAARSRPCSTRSRAARQPAAQAAVPRQPGGCTRGRR